MILDQAAKDECTALEADIDHIRQEITKAREDLRAASTRHHREKRELERTVRGPIDTYFF